MSSEITTPQASIDELKEIAKWLRDSISQHTTIEAQKASNAHHKRIVGIAWARVMRGLEEIDGNQKYICVEGGNYEWFHLREYIEQHALYMDDFDADTPKPFNKPWRYRVDENGKKLYGCRVGYSSKASKNKPYRSDAEINQWYKDQALCWALQLDWLAGFIEEKFIATDAKRKRRSYDNCGPKPKPHSADCYLCWESLGEARKKRRREDDYQFNERIEALIEAGDYAYLLDEQALTISKIKTLHKNHSQNRTRKNANHHLNLEKEVIERLKQSKKKKKRATVSK